MPRQSIKMTSKIIPIVFAVLAFGFASACSPEVGSKEWCADMKEKAKGEWSANEATEFAKSCIL